MATSEKSGKKIQALLMIFFPLLFAIIVGWIVMLLMGIDVFGKVKELPVISSFATKDKNIDQNTGNHQVELLNKKIVQQNKVISRLEKDLSSKETEVLQLKDDLAAAKKREETSQSSKTNQEESAKTNDKKEKVVNWYNAMSPKNAAAIIEEMKTKEAIEILNMLDDEATAGILEKMTPKKAAELTILFKQRR